MLKPKKIERDNKEQTLAKDISSMNILLIGMSKAGTSLKKSDGIWFSTSEARTAPIYDYLQNKTHIFVIRLLLGKTDRAFLRRSSERLFPVGTRSDENNSKSIVLVNALIEYTLFATKARGTESLISLW